MATQPGDVPANNPPETPVPPAEPGEPFPPAETPPSGPDVDEPDTAPVELPPPD
ncbi:hypothetical protein GCM10011494_28350 [Novosphingobium endophyticum]|uniref:Uncharacterized protein n=1 Tax=Novosphingobium endophyticum TaxID=1955250 RepID=A0A916TTU8_9SPHN|nr:hypothetical protein [Novosphingobium endophyticum]GGC08035.1 hypothetical protein GCM10011494_28350 [Novosphingobium endophyticum]